jgi:hypothetical protein
VALSAGIKLPIAALVLLLAGFVVSGIATGPVSAVVEDIREVGDETAQSPGESDQDGSEEGDEPNSDQGDGSALQEPQFESPPSVATVGQTKTFKANIQASEQVLTQARVFTRSEPSGAGTQLTPQACGDDNSQLVSECTIQQTVAFDDVDSSELGGYNLVVETQFETDAESSTQLDTKIAETDVEVVEIQWEAPDNLQGGGDPTIRAVAKAAPDAPILENAELIWDTDADSTSGPDNPSMTSCTGQQTGIGAVGPDGAEECDIQRSFEFPPGEYSADVRATFGTDEGPVTSTETIQVTPGPGLTFVVNNIDGNPVKNAKVTIDGSDQSGMTNADGKVRLNDLGEEEIEFDVECDTYGLNNNQVDPTSTAEESIELPGTDVTDCSE